MVGKGLRILFPAALALLVASQWQDIVRYVKLKQLSAGQGHPEYVPVRGRASYPQRPGSGQADGHGTSARPAGAARAPRGDGSPSARPDLNAPARRG